MSRPVSVPVYFRNQPAAPLPLRPLTALEQMYAYWGTDLA